MNKPQRCLCSDCNAAENYVTATSQRLANRCQPTVTNVCHYYHSTLTDSLFHSQFHSLCSKQELMVIGAYTFENKCKKVFLLINEAKVREQSSKIKLSQKIKRRHLRLNITNINKYGITKICQIYIPSNCPGNMLTTVNKSEWPWRILRTMPLVLDSRPGPNITSFGFFGQIDRSMSERRWKLKCFCFESFATSGEHRKYL